MICHACGASPCQCRLTPPKRKRWRAYVAGFVLGLLAFAPAVVEVWLRHGH